MAHDLQRRTNETIRKSTRRKGNSVFGALGADWTDQNEIHFLKHNNQLKFATRADVHELRAFYKYSARVEALYYIKEKNEEIENTARVSAVTCGLLGVATVCGSVFGEEKSREKRQRNGVLGGLMAAAGVVGGLTSQCYAFHGFLTLQCSEGVWVSMEKNNEGISLQIGSSRNDVTQYKNGGASSSKYNIDDNDHVRGETRELRHMLLKELRNRRRAPGVVYQEEDVLTLEEVLMWIVDTGQDDKGYNIITRNCQNFAEELWAYASRFSSDPQPFPDYVNNLEEGMTQMITGRVKGLTSA